jgi:hypothetical protein
MVADNILMCQILPTSLYLYTHYKSECVAATKYK